MHFATFLLGIFRCIAQISHEIAIFRTCDDDIGHLRHLPVGPHHLHLLGIVCKLRKIIPIFFTHPRKPNSSSPGLRHLSKSTSDIAATLNPFLTRFLRTASPVGERRKKRENVPVSAWYRVFSVGCFFSDILLPLFHMPATARPFLGGRRECQRGEGGGDIMGPEKRTSGKAEKKEEVENSLDTKKNTPRKYALKSKLLTDVAHSDEPDLLGLGIFLRGRRRGQSGGDRHRPGPAAGGGRGKEALSSSLQHGFKVLYVVCW